MLREFHHYNFIEKNISSFNTRTATYLQYEIAIFAQCNTHHPNAMACGNFVIALNRILKHLIYASKYY
jgi:hypothetical protein